MGDGTWGDEGIRKGLGCWGKWCQTGELTGKTDPLGGYEKKSLLTPRGRFGINGTRTSDEVRDGKKGNE